MRPIRPFGGLGKRGPDRAEQNLSGSFRASLNDSPSGAGQGRQKPREAGAIDVEVATHPPETIDDQIAPHKVDRAIRVVGRGHNLAGVLNDATNIQERTATGLNGPFQELRRGDLLSVSLASAALVEPVEGRVGGLFTKRANSVNNVTPVMEGSSGAQGPRHKSSDGPGALRVPLFGPGEPRQIIENQ